MLNSYHKFTLSKKCIDMRDKEKRHFKIKEYQMANQIRQQADQLEILEI